MKEIIKNNIRITAIVLCVFILSACDKNFSEINVNPNTPTAEVIPVDNLFMGILTNVAGETHDETMAIISDLFGFAFPSGVAFYDHGTADKWGMYSSLKNVVELLKITDVNGRQPNVVNHAVAKIIRVIYYQRLTDLFGAIPYSESVRGLDFPQPKYDSVETIYKDMAKELGDAIAEINSVQGGAYSPAVDLVYKSDAKKWAKFANSLRLRIGMRIRFVDPATANTIITASMAAPLMGSNSDSWAFKYPGQEDSNSSRFYSTTKPNRFVSESLMSKFRATSDPRMYIYGDGAGIKNNIYQGQINGLNMNFDDGAQSVIGSIIWKVRTLPAYLMTYAEVNFLKSEAMLAGIVTGDANAEYRNGIRASMEQWGVAESAIVTFLASPEATLKGSNEEKLKQIAYQKWIALYTNGHEAYAEMRRTGYPTVEKRPVSKVIQRFDPNGNLVSVSVGFQLGLTDGVFPRRVEYPNSEKELNPVNVANAIKANGGDLLDRIWWDVR